MKNPHFAFNNCLRHAFMSGAGYGDYDRISDAHIDAWCNYDPPESGPFKTMFQLIAGAPVEVNGEPPKPFILHPNVFGGAPEPAPFQLVSFLAKDIEYMWKEIAAVIPEGSIWQHVDNLAHYRVLGLSLNCITDEWDVEYAPLYKCRYGRFTRQAANHEKSFASRFMLVDDGSTYADGRLYPAEFSTPPKEKDND